MRNESEQLTPSLGETDGFDPLDWRSLRRHVSKEDLAKAVIRMKKQMRRIKLQSDKFMAKLKDEVLKKDMGHEQHPNAAPNFILADTPYECTCTLCGVRFWSHHRGICAGKVNDKLDALVELDGR